MISAGDRLLRISLAVLLTTILTIAAVASVGQFFLKHFATLGVVGWGCLVVYAAVFGALIVFCAQPRLDLRS